jgi:hypothetical protein
MSTYRRAEGCLAEFGDGEAVRLLPPACMHYFHAECVGEWLHAPAHDTRPPFGAPLDPAAAAF